MPPRLNRDTIDAYNDASDGFAACWAVSELETAVSVLAILPEISAPEVSSSPLTAADEEGSSSARAGTGSVPQTRAAASTKLSKRFFINYLLLQLQEQPQLNHTQTNPVFLVVIYQVIITLSGTKLNRKHVKNRKKIQ